MDALSLIERLDTYSQKLHPNYTREQRMAWIMGILASVAVRKTHMDTDVWARLKHNLESLINPYDD